MSYQDIVGSGFVSGLPGYYANCRVYYKEGQVQHIGPLYQVWTPEGGVEEPSTEAPVEDAVAPVLREPAFTAREWEGIQQQKVERQTARQEALSSPSESIAEEPPAPEPVQDQPQEVVPPSEPAIQQSLGG